MEAAKQRIELECVMQCLRCLTEKSAKNIKHPRVIAQRTAESRYLTKGDGLGLDLGPTIAIAQQFGIREWELLVKCWGSIPDGLEADVKNIPFDISCWLQYCKSIRAEYPTLLSCTATGMLIDLFLLKQLRLV